MAKWPRDERGSSRVPKGPFLLISLSDAKKGYDWDWPGAEAEYKRGLNLNPSYAIAHMWYADYLSKMGRHADAIAESARARELDPISVDSNAFF